MERDLDENLDKLLKYGGQVELTRHLAAMMVNTRDEHRSLVNRHEAVVHSVTQRLASVESGLTAASHREIIANRVPIGVAPWHVRASRDIGPSAVEVRSVQDLEVQETRDERDARDRLETLEASHEVLADTVTRLASESVRDGQAIRKLVDAVVDLREKTGFYQRSALEQVESGGAAEPYDRDERDVASPSTVDVGLDHRARSAQIDNTRIAELIAERDTLTEQVKVQDEFIERLQAQQSVISDVDAIDIATALGLHPYAKLPESIAEIGRLRNTDERVGLEARHRQLAGALQLNVSRLWTWNELLDEVARITRNLASTCLERDEAIARCEARQDEAPSSLTEALGMSHLSPWSEVIEEVGRLVQARNDHGRTKAKLDKLGRLNDEIESFIYVPDKRIAEAIVKLGEATDCINQLRDRLAER